MRTLAAILVLAVASGAAASASAQTRLTDIQFVKVARCAGLAGDDRFDAVYKANEKGRSPFAIAKADEARDSAAREARRVQKGRTPGGQERIDAELGGACAALKS